MKKLLLATAMLAATIPAAKAQMMCDNPVLNCIYSRTSVRDYTTAHIPDSIQEALLRAGMCAPSAINRQPWQFICVDNPEIRAAIAKAVPNSHAAKAPLCIVVCGDMDKAMEGRGRDFWIQDCSAASQNILLAAHSMGLGGVWCGVYPDDNRVQALRKTLSIPANVVPLNVLCLGYPAHPTAPKDKWKPTNVHRNGY